MKKLILLSLLASAVSSQAAITFFDLSGRAGSGLIAGNENGTVLGTPGSGGETGGGIFFDDSTSTLTVNILWSGLQGATAGSSGSATGMHIHGIVGAPDPFLGNSGVVVNFLTNTGSANFTSPSYTVTNNASGTGSVSGTVVLNATAIAALNQSRLYINVHTGLNGGGEIRGNLVPVPEPAGTALAVIGLGLLSARRRRA
jgi:CHRD domain